MIVLNPFTFFFAYLRIVGISLWHKFSEWIAWHKAVEHSGLRLVYRSEHLLNMFCSLYWWSKSSLAWQPSWSLESFCPALLYPFQTSAVMCMWGLRVYQLQWYLIKLAVRVVNKDLSNFFVSCIYLSSTPTEGCDSDPVSLTLCSLFQ